MKSSSRKRDPLSASPSQSPTEARHSWQALLRQNDLLFEKHPSPMLLLDPEHLTVIDANPAFTQLCGRSVEKLVGRKLADLSPPEARAGIERTLEEMREEPERASIGWRCETSQGATLSLEIVFSRNEETRPPMWLGVARDLGGRRAAEAEVLHREVASPPASGEHYLKREFYEQIRSSPAMLEFLDSGSLDGIWYWDLERKENEWMSPGFWRSLGYDPAERRHLSSEWQRLILPQDLAKVRESIDEHLADPQRPFDQLVRYRHKTGSIVWIRCRGMAIRDAQGKPLRMLGIHLDVSKALRSEVGRISAEEFNAFFEDAAVGALQLDPQGRFIKVNRRYCDLVRYNREELLGKRLFEPEIYKNAERDHPILQKLLRGELKRHNWESQCICKDGKLVWIRLSASAHVDPSGDIVSINGIAEDITESKHGEFQREFIDRLHVLIEQTREPAELVRKALQALVEHLEADGAGFGELGADGDELAIHEEVGDGRPSITGTHRATDYGMPAAFEKLRHGKAVLVNDVANDPLTKDHLKNFRKIAVGAFACQPVVTPGGPKALITITTKEPRTWTLSDQRLLREVAARLMPAVERARSEEALAESEGRFRSTFENAAVGMAHVAVDGRWLRANQRLCDLLGYTCEELLETTVDHVGHPGDLEAAWSQSRQALAGEIHNYSMDMRYLRKDSSPIWVTLTVSLQRAPNGEPEHFIAFVRDITERVLAEQSLKQREKELLEAKRHAESANRSKDEFLSVMSHELRTPLNPIIGFAQLLAEKSDDPFVQEASSFTLHSAGRMLELVESILDFTRLSEREPSPRIEPFQLDDLLEEPRALRSPASNAPKIEFSNGSGHIKPIRDECRLLGPLSTIRQTLMKLLSNAIKHGEDSEIRVAVGLEDDGADPKSQRLTIEVSDRGPGIPESFQPDLFHPFTQVDSSLTRSQEGLGLGLAICKKLVAQIHGDIGYRKNEPKGSIFWFSVPITVEDLAAADEKSTSTKSDESERSLAGLKTLIVEDNQDNADYFRFVLRAAQAEPSHVSSGKEAIELCCKETFDVAMIDISMKEMSGFDVLRALRELPNFSHTLCVAVTAHASETMRQTCLREGFNSFIAKPVSPDQLKESISRMLARP